jgi:hypothetical protein
VLAAKVPEPLFVHLHERVKNESSGIRRVSSWPIERTFVYIDVSDFSKERAPQQTYIVKSIVADTNDKYWSEFQGSPPSKMIEASICIGDGYIFVFNDPLYATAFAGYLACLIEYLVARGELMEDFHFRMGVHTGPVFCFWDPGRNNWNYIGDGINGGQRVLSAIGKDSDDVVFVSRAVREHLAAVTGGPMMRTPVRTALHNRGRKADKHGGLWRVYELNHAFLFTPAVESSLETVSQPCLA